MSTEPKKQKPKPGPDPERLIIDEDPKEALRRLLRAPEPSEEDAKDFKTGEWYEIADVGNPDHRHRAVEYEDEDGKRHRVPAGDTEFTLTIDPPKSRPQAVRWRYIED